MDTLFSGRVDDMLIVPVNFSYEKLIEGNYIREQLGKPKVNESFLAAVIGVWNSCQTKFGNARIDFGQPFSVKVTKMKFVLNSNKFMNLTWVWL